MRACHSQQWVALEVLCKPIRSVFSHSGVRLVTGEQRAAQVRGVYYPPFGLGLVCAVEGASFSPPASGSSQSPETGSCLLVLSCGSSETFIAAILVSVETGPWSRALTEKQWRSMGMWCRRRSTSGNKKHPWAQFYSTYCEGHACYCWARHTASSPGGRAGGGTELYSSMWLVAYFFICHRSEQQCWKLESCMDAVTLAVAILLKLGSWDSYTSKFPQPSVVIWEVKGKQPYKFVTFVTEAHAGSFFKPQKRKLCGSM